MSWPCVQNSLQGAELNPAAVGQIQQRLHNPSQAQSILLFGGGTRGGCRAFDGPPSRLQALLPKRVQDQVLTGGCAGHGVPLAPRFAIPDLEQDCLVHGLRLTGPQQRPDITNAPSLQLQR